MIWFGKRNCMGTCDACCNTREFLTAYSTPPQTGDSGMALIFDRNGTVNGNAVTHVRNSSTFKVCSPGYYSVSFHSALSPAGQSDFPLPIILYLEKQGHEVPGAAVQHTFHTSTDVCNVAFSQIIEIKTVPSVLQIIGQGGAFYYSACAITIQKIGTAAGK